MFFVRNTVGQFINMICFWSREFTNFFSLIFFQEIYLNETNKNYDKKSTMHDRVAMQFSEFEIQVWYFFFTSQFQTTML